MKNSLPTYQAQPLSDVVTSEYAVVKIIDRHPKAGNPSPGIPLGITVQVQTKNSGATWFRTPFKCVDAFVAVRDYHTKEVLGGEFVLTSLEDNCRGKARINLGNYRPAKGSMVQLELYEGGTTEWFQSRTTIEDVVSGDKKPIQISKPFSLYMSFDKAKEAGLVTSAETSLLNKLTSQLETSPTKLMLAAGLGLGIYLTLPMLPGLIRNFTKGNE